MNMKNTIKLNETDLNRIIKRVIEENYTPGVNYRMRLFDLIHDMINEGGMTPNEVRGMVDRILEKQYQ